MRQDIARKVTEAKAKDEGKSARALVALTAKKMGMKLSEEEMETVLYWYGKHGKPAISYHLDMMRTSPYRKGSQDGPK